MFEISPRIARDVRQVSKQFVSTIGDALIVTQRPSKRLAGERSRRRIECSGLGVAEEGDEERKEAAEQFEGRGPVHDLEDRHLLGERQIGERRGQLTAAAWI